MMLRHLWTKYREAITYIIFGILTTLVNYAVYFPLYNFTNLPASVTNSIAWVAAVLFAFFVNKRYVFKSGDWSSKQLVLEGLKFAACRVGSGLLETGVLLLTADILFLNGNLWKIIVSVVVVILNYFGSKFFVFRK